MRWEHLTRSERSLPDGWISQSYIHGSNKPAFATHWIAAFNIHQIQACIQSITLSDFLLYGFFRLHSHFKTPLPIQAKQIRPPTSTLASTCPIPQQMQTPGQAPNPALSSTPQQSVFYPHQPRNTLAVPVFAPPT